MRAATPLALALAMAASSAAAHDWYDQSCCGGTHCHPVPDGFVRELGTGVEVKGYGLLSYTDPRLHRSLDDHDHVCENFGKLLCVYRRVKEM